MENTQDMELSEILKETTRGMRELLLNRAEHHQSSNKDFEAYLGYAGGNNYSRVNAMDLLSLENGLLANLQSVQESLSNLWSAEDTRTCREVLEDGE